MIAVIIIEYAGGAVEAAANRKTHEYTDLPAAHIFQPLAFETHGRHGATHSSAFDFLNAVGGRSAAESGDPRETSFLWQRISILIQRFNAILISETFSCPTKHQTSSYSRHLLI